MKRIAVMIETSRAYGRALMEGIAAHAQAAGDWRLRSLANDRLGAAGLREYDGVILRLADRRTAARILASGTPAVDVYGGGTPRIPVSDSDHRRIGALAAEFFLKRGFRSLAWCGIDGLGFSDRRGTAFCAAVASAGFTPLRYARPRRIRADSSLFYDERLDRIPDADELARWLGSLPRPTAVFCCHDYRAYQLMQVATDLGLGIPQDLSVLGVDNDTTLCSFAPIPLSSVDPDAFEVGRAAAAMLDGMMSGGRAPASAACAPRGIVERESTEFVPSGIPWLSAALLFIEKNHPRGISAADVIAQTGRSPTFVERVFRKETGLSVQAHITRMRMNLAERLLATTDLMVKEIAGRCGYRSAQYFCRAFSATHHGRSPLSFR